MKIYFGEILKLKKIKNGCQKIKTKYKNIENPKNILLHVVQKIKMIEITMAPKSYFFCLTLPLIFTISQDV